MKNDCESKYWSAWFSALSIQIHGTGNNLCSLSDALDDVIIRNVDENYTLAAGEPDGNEGYAGHYRIYTNLQFSPRKMNHIITVSKIEGSYPSRVFYCRIERQEGNWIHFIFSTQVWIALVASFVAVICYQFVRKCALRFDGKTHLILYFSILSSISSTFRVYFGQNLGTGLGKGLVSLSLLVSVIRYLYVCSLFGNSFSGNGEQVNLLTLKDLLDSNYKFRFFYADGYHREFLLNEFAKLENSSSSTIGSSRLIALERSERLMDYKRMDKSAVFLKTLDIMGKVTMKLWELMSPHNDTKCHVALHNYSSDLSNYYVFISSKVRKFTRVVSRLQESGVFNYFRVNLLLFNEEFHSREELRYSNQAQGVDVSRRKFTGVFIVILFLFGISCIAFMAEQMHNFCL
jgi:hypothetical protein